jgi:site-specific DNA recombinase
MPRRALAAVPDQPRRVVAYRRVSALMGRGGDDFHSPDVQLQAIRRVTTGMVEVAVIDDIDRTGRHFAREGIDKIRALAEAGHLDVLAVYDVSRLGRNVRESLAFLSRLADRGVTIVSACEQVDTLRRDRRRLVAGHRQTRRRRPPPRPRVRLHPGQ